MTKNNGGQAFSFSGSNYDPPSKGMTLRDYFAGQALNGMMTRWRETSITYAPEVMANEMYTIADAMIEERNKQ